MPPRAHRHAHHRHAHRVDADASPAAGVAVRKAEHFYRRALELSPRSGELLNLATYVWHAGSAHHGGGAFPYLSAQYTQRHRDDIHVPSADLSSRVWQEYPASYWAEALALAVRAADAQHTPGANDDGQRSEALCFAAHLMQMRYLARGYSSTASTDASACTGTREAFPRGDHTHMCS